MSSLATRSAVLTFARLCKYALVAIGPLFLVRLLSIEEFGKFREFVLYGMVATTLMGFSVNNSLPYFIPRYPKEERLYLTQAVLLRGCFCAIGVAAILLAKPFIVSFTTFDFVVPLVLLLIVSLSFDFVETYFLAKKRPDYILYYSSAHVAVRVAAVTITAYYTAHVQAVIYALIGVEALRCALVGGVTLRNKLLVAEVRWEKMRYQISYFLPLGVASILVTLNESIGKMYISGTLGASALALYAVGTYLVPLINVFRSSLADVIFPEMVGKSRQEKKPELILWRRATVVYCFLLFPTVLLLFFHAEIFIVTLFTNSYLAAIPVFKVLLLIPVRSCFDFHLPLRLVNKNVHFLAANLGALVVNLLLMIVLYRWLGFIGPAVALVVADTLMAVYLGAKVLSVFEIRLNRLLEWQQIGRVLLATLLAMPALLLVELMPGNTAIRAVTSSLVYGVVYVFVAQRLGITEVIVLREKLAARLSRFRKEKGTALDEY